MEKCLNNGNSLNMCDTLREVTTHLYGDIEAQIMTTLDRKSSRFIIVAGRFKKNRVKLDYYPFCGMNIETKHKDSTND